MLQAGDAAPIVDLKALDGSACRVTREAADRPTLLVFFESDCPTCRLTLPYVNKMFARLGSKSAQVLGISQDDEESTRRLIRDLGLGFPVALDRELAVSRAYDLIAVPSLFLLDEAGRISLSSAGLDKDALNQMVSLVCLASASEPFILADPFDGNPGRKPGCCSRHLERRTFGDAPSPGAAFPAAGSGSARASRIRLEDDRDPYEYCMDAFGDPLPVVPPTVERVDRMLRGVALPPEEVVGLVPPNYGRATVEKIAANAVMAGCRPELMPVLLTLVRAACDERFNLHGIQATTHFAAPLIMVNGPVRESLGFACAGNVFSNVARANSTLGRAFQLILTNLGGAKPAGIDMSTLGNPGKFSYCIAENEEESPWEPLHVEIGFRREESTLTLFAAEPPRGVSEHTAREGRQVLRAIARALATVWSYRVCRVAEALVVLCPEHAKTLYRDGFTKAGLREYLFENTGIPVSEYDDAGGEGSQLRHSYVETTIDGKPCYRKFRDPESIRTVVAGGRAGKFSAVIGSWASGPRGSQMVSYPLP